MTQQICEICDFKCYKPADWSRHIKTKKHIGRSDLTHKKFECNLCAFICYKKSAYNAHENTQKHINRSKTISAHNIEQDEIYINEVSHKNESANGLADFTRPPDFTRPEYFDVVKQLLAQNNELKNFIIEQAHEHKKETNDILNRVIEQANEHKKDTIDIIAKVIEQTKSNNTTNNTTMTNSNNKSFNINMFLNEECKDAINFSDFIKNIEVSREDLENNAQLGFVNGVSKILIDSLKQLSKNERPIHCTDVKRETMYIKDEDKWNKEEDSSKLNKAIQEVTRKSMGTLLDWKAENPDYKDNDSEFSNRCITIQKNSMAGYDRDTYYPKVVKAVAKEVLVNK